MRRNEAWKKVITAEKCVHVMPGGEGKKVKLKMKEAEGKKSENVSEEMHVWKNLKRFGMLPRVTF